MKTLIMYTTLTIIIAAMIILIILSPTKKCTIQNECTIQDGLYQNKNEPSVPVEKYNQMLREYINKNNRLINITKQAISDRNFWQEEDAEKGRQIMLCWDSNTGVPKKLLDREYVCSQGCYYHLLCTDSMKPFFDCTDTLVVYENVEQDEIELCDVIGFKSPEYPQLEWVVHRIIGFNESGYRTKGDANAIADNYTIRFEDILFKVIGVEYR